MTEKTRHRHSILIFGFLITLFFCIFAAD